MVGCSCSKGVLSLIVQMVILNILVSDNDNLLSSLMYKYIMVATRLKSCVYYPTSYHSTL
ncbi:hypothetical protein GLYMA_02G002350v4 [Glycine max]|nr:hypothetical protein GLYMA_02G002350v4 [Glycine max]KAH1058062.1 hypothetical protein GYH30_002572 [Glycine max]